ncbi:RHS repeat-associated core domain-containing protein [Paludibaculum fermentans]|uniref:RHS repeat-associated core domain-containing protein n=1 Tax=Paludibaculum fermentans TaxID=1473598 RepID=A0A7S7NYR4_PALFE|nr:RHS repeat-associated core domain-containing protein [Paludibaculum fermentans]
MSRYQHLSYYPYGEQQSGNASADREKFATYTRDGVSSLDYAQNRYYSPQFGRFTTADPYQGIRIGENPQSWNMYAYVANDPVNYLDPRGLNMRAPGGPCPAEYQSCDPFECDPMFESCPGGGTPGYEPSPAPTEEPDPPYSAFAATQRARADLGKKDCFELLGFSSADAAQKWFDRLKFNYLHLGNIVVNNGVPADKPAAANTKGFGTININLTAVQDRAHLSHLVLNSKGS